MRAAHKTALREYLTAEAWELVGAPRALSSLLLASPYTCASRNRAVVVLRARDLRVKGRYYTTASTTTRFPWGLHTPVRKTIAGVLLFVHKSLTVAKVKKLGGAPA